MNRLPLKPILLATLAVAALTIGLLWWHERSLTKVFRAGLAAAEKKDQEGVLAAIKKLEGASQFASHRHLLLGMSHGQRGEIREALSELASAVGNPETTAQALVCSGRIFMEVGDHANALRMLTGALEADPKSVDAHRFLIASYYDVGAMEQVLQHIEKVIELAPDDMRPWRMRGLILKDFERYEEAVPSYEGALRLSPPKHVEQEIRGELAESLLQLRRYDDALVQLNQLEQSAEQQSMIAEAMLALGKNNEADKAIAKALELDARNRRAMQTKASVLLEQGDVQAAADLLQQAVLIHPQEVDLRSSLMLAYQRLGKSELADAQQTEMNRLRELQDRFNKLHIRSIQNSADVNCRIELARTAIQLNKFDAAVSWYRAALSMDPANSLIRQEFQKLTETLAPSTNQ